VLASYIKGPSALFFSLSSLALDPRIRTTNTIGFALHLGASLSTVLTEFVTLATGIEKYNLGLENIYNWDEKGFIIGLMNRVYRIMILEALRSGKTTHTMTDSNREFLRF
jgi:hypothetical protein